MHSADPAVEAAAHGKATSDRREEKDAPRPKQKRPVDPATHELPIPRGPPPPRVAFTVREFCEAHRISPAKYYEMKKEGWGPVEMSVGRRRLISYEAASLWRRKRELGTATSSARAE
jgi:hypothetical protein